jgi:hypothetical protein
VGLPRLSTIWRPWIFRILAGVRFSISSACRKKGGKRLVQGIASSAVQRQDSPEAGLWMELGLGVCAVECAALGCLGYAMQSFL